MIWYSHLFQNFPQFIVIHRVKGFGIVNKAEIDVFLERNAFQNYNEISHHSGQNGSHQKNLYTMNPEKGVVKREHSCTVGRNVN